MGGEPIRGNEWLSTLGHSACYTCGIEKLFLNWGNDYRHMRLFPFNIKFA